MTYKKESYDGIKFVMGVAGVDVADSDSSSCDSDGLYTDSDMKEDSDESDESNTFNSKKGPQRKESSKKKIDFGLINNVFQIQKSKQQKWKQSLKAKFIEKAKKEAENDKEK